MTARRAPDQRRHVRPDGRFAQRQQHRVACADAEISQRVEAAISKFDALKPWGVASDLAAGTQATRALIEKVKASSLEAANKDHVLFLLGNKEQEFNDAMHKALGLVMEVLVDPERASEGPASFLARRLR